MQLPKVHKPRTTNDPEAEEVWPMTLQEAIRIGLDNSEIVRVIPFGAQGIPIGGFEPSPLNTGAGGGAAGALGAGSLQSVYDPAIQETQIAQALSVFDTAFTTNMTWGKNTQPFNNAIQGGSLGFSGAKTLILSVQDTANFQIGLQKRTATGAQIGIVHNVNWLYQNSTFLTYPLGLYHEHPDDLDPAPHGSCPLPGQNPGRPVGLEANRAPIVIARLQRRRRRLEVQGRASWPMSGRSSSNTGAWPSSTCSSGAPRRPSSWPARSSIANRPSWSWAREPSPTSPKPSSGSNSSTLTW